MIVAFCVLLQPYVLLHHRGVYSISWTFLSSLVVVASDAVMATYAHVTRSSQSDSLVNKLVRPTRHRAPRQGALRKVRPALQMPRDSGPAWPALPHHKTPLSKRVISGRHWGSAVVRYNDHQPQQGQVRWDRGYGVQVMIVTGRGLACLAL